MASETKTRSGKSRRRRPKQGLTTKNRDDLIIHYCGYLSKIIHHVAPWSKVGQYDSIAKIAIIIAIDSYSDQKGMSLYSWIHLKVKGAILDDLRAYLTRRGKTRHDYDKKIEREEVRYIRYEENCHFVQTNENELIAKIELTKRFDRLSDFQKSIIKLYNDGYFLFEIANMMKKKHYTIWSNYHKAMNILKEVEIKPKK